MEDEAQPVFWRMKPEVVEYREEWPRLFEQEKAFLEGKFACVLSQIEHFGSTSIPGMWAKPIIDMQCVALPMPPSAETLAALSKFSSKPPPTNLQIPSEELLYFTEELGYAHRPTEDVDRAEYMRFDKGDPVVTHCLHLRNTRAESAVSFRDYLRAHPEDVQR